LETPFCLALLPLELPPELEEPLIAHLAQHIALPSKAKTEALP
jgi:hypothetical protein